MKSVSSRSMIRCLRTTRSARSRPAAVRIASLRSPRSTSPSASVEPIESALTAGRDGRFLWLAALLAAGFALGLLTLVYYDAYMKRRRSKALLGTGAASTAEFERQQTFIGAMSPARWLALFIATGIGLHNFSEGLAIGQSAARDEVSLALMLIMGFGRHNAPEGLGLVPPLPGEKDPPSWSFL